MEIRCFIAYYMVKDINFLYKLNQEIPFIWRQITFQKKIHNR